MAGLVLNQTKILHIQQAKPLLVHRPPKAWVAVVGA
jgi:hypothetical protein